MQTLWARVAQVRTSCKCSLCHSSLNGLSQRATVPSSRRRIIQTQGDFFLVFSSTIAFEAVILDSARKSERARQWDTAIEEERARVLAVDMDQKKRIDQLLENAQRRAVNNTPTRKQRKENNVFYRTNKLPDAPRGRPASTQYLYWDWRGVFEWSARCDELRADAGFQGWKGVPLNWLKTLSTAELEELLRDRKLLHYYYGGQSCAELEPLAPTQPGSIKKLRTLEWSVLKMALRLIQAAHSFEPVAPVIASREMTKANEVTSLASPLKRQTLLAKANQNLSTLHLAPATSDIYENFERPHFPTYHWKGESHDEELSELNQLLHAKLKKLKGRDGFAQVLKLICMDLLTSTTPPNIHVYNLLIVRLCELKEDSLLWIVLESMHETHVRPNEITHATLLRFFTMRDDRFAFCCYLDKMCGKRRGLALADPKQEIHPLIARQFRRFGIQTHRTAVLARKNQEVYSSLLVGMLRFFKPRDAMYWYRAMINEGWRPTTEILIHILSSCCAELDWEGGVAVWEQFHREGIKLTSIAYEWMLQLCRSCGREDVFSDVLSEGIRHGVLTARILELPSEVLLGDVDVLLEKAKNHEKPRGSQDRVPKEMKHRLLEFEEAEGRHLIENALHQSSRSRSAARERLNLLSRLALKFAALKRARESIRSDLERLNTDISITTEEILRQVKVPASIIVRYQASKSFKEPAEDLSAIAAHNAYRKWQKLSVAAGGKTKPEPSNHSEFPSAKDFTSGTHVDLLNPWWFPRMFSPDKVDELPETAVG